MAGDDQRMPADRAGEDVDQQRPGQRDVAAADEARRKAMTSDDFLVPGPAPGTNEGLGRWGLSWLMFSIALIVMMALMSWICLVLARWIGMA